MTTTRAELTHDQLTALLERHQLPAPTNLVRLDETSWLIDDAIMLQVDDEQRLVKLAVIYRRLHAASLPTPTVVALETAHDQLSPDTPARLLTRIVAGTNAATIWPELNTDSQEQLSEALGRVVAAVHNLRWPAYGDVVAVEAGTNLGASSYQRWIDMLYARLVGCVVAAKALNAIPARLIDGVVTALNDGESLLETASRPTLVHGALNWNNVVLTQADGQWQVAQLSGWEHALIADVAWEFTSLWQRRDWLYPDPDWFLGGYKEVRKPDPERRPRVKLYRLLLHLEAALTAAQRGDAESRRRHEIMLAWSLRHL